MDNMKGRLIISSVDRPIQPGINSGDFRYNFENNISATTLLVDTVIVPHSFFNVPDPTTFTFIYNAVTYTVNFTPQEYNNINGFVNDLDALMTAAVGGGGGTFVIVAQADGFTRFQIVAPNTLTINFTLPTNQIVRRIMGFDKLFYTAAGAPPIIVSPNIWTLNPNTMLVVNVSGLFTEQAYVNRKRQYFTLCMLENTAPFRGINVYLNETGSKIQATPNISSLLVEVRNEYGEVLELYDKPVSISILYK